MKTQQNYFDGFEYASVMKYIHKIASGMKGMLTDRTLEYEDLVSQGVYAACNAFRKWDESHNSDRTDTTHLEAYVKRNISGYMTNMFLDAKRRNQLICDEEDLCNVEDDGEEEESYVVEGFTTYFDDDSDNINGRSQRKYAKVFHAGSDEASVAMMDVASAKNEYVADERMTALEAFICTLSGIELDIMNTILKRTKDSIKVIATRYNVSQGYISRKQANIKEAAKEFILNY